METNGTLLCPTRNEVRRMIKEIPPTEEEKYEMSQEIEEPIDDTDYEFEQKEKQSFIQLIKKEPIFDIFDNEVGVKK